MRITQSYTGATSHKPHTTGTPKDYPIDEGAEDTGRSYIYCPCDEMRVVRIYGVGNGGTNTLWLESTDKVLFADGTRDYFTMLILHPDDSELKKLRQGQLFKRKQPVCLEGKDGATAYHFHISGGKGRLKGNGWTKNTKGKWVLTTTGGAERPQRLFYLDRSFTEVKSSKGLSFLALPDGEQRVYPTGDYRVTADLLNVRTGPGTEYERKSFSQLSTDAQRKILALSGYKANGYVKNLEFTAFETKEGWGRSPSGWVSLQYCRKI